MNAFLVALLRYAFALPLLFALAPRADAQRRLVPEEYASIQSAIRAAAAGDTVLVRDGVYVENLDFLGKDVVVASHFALDGDYAHVLDTVIDGSDPAHPDTASVVLFVSGETRAAVLEGFTLTGGQGTRWSDEHGFGFFVEGGGILIQASSPTIRFNRIVGNEAVRVCDDCTSAGGGGVRVGDGAPLLDNNVIDGNRGLYGGGVVLNYAAGTLQNNVVVRNRVIAPPPGTPSFGGGGVWVYGSNPPGAGPNVLENNTVAENAVEHAAAQGGFANRGGGVLGSGTALVMRNNVVWANTQTANDRQVARFSDLTFTSAYNDVQGEAALPGTGNFDVDPLLLADFSLPKGSPVVDLGDPDVAHNDPEDPARPGQAAFPAWGTTRADVGAFGGPGAAVLGVTPVVAEPIPAAPSAIGMSAFPNPTSGIVRVGVATAVSAPVSVEVLDVLGRRAALLFAGPLAAGAHTLSLDASALPAGAYFLRAQGGGGATVHPITVVH